MPRAKRKTIPSPSPSLPPPSVPPEVVLGPPRLTGDFSVSPLLLPPAPVATAELELDRILFDE